MNYFSGFIISILFAATAFATSPPPKKFIVDDLPPITHDPKERSGIVCAGPDLSPVRSNPSLQVKVGTHPKRPFEKWQWVAKDLSLADSHTVVVYDGEKPISSWKFNFQKLKTNFVIVWKAYGAWKMKPLVGGTCDLKY